ncbi:LEA type 2 family protein [Stutzerimonas tarimensis]|uniref:LEA type 2 family protein n=1 Tax=Stutzerimonas tarimensis TaxID=1507735 RepID=A0ABV7T4K9_9GAMM
MTALSQKQLYLRTWLLLGLMLGLSGCSTWFGGRFEQPDVELVKVDIVKARMLEQEFLLRFRIDNPNDKSLPVRGLVYKVWLNDLELAEGESSAWANIPANSRGIYEVPVRTNLWRHMRYVVRLLERPSQPIRYRLDGELKTGMMFGQRVQISRDGEIIPADFVPE